MSYADKTYCILKIGIHYLITTNQKVVWTRWIRWCNATLSSRRQTGDHLHFSATCSIQCLCGFCIYSSKLYSPFKSQATIFLVDLASQLIPVQAVTDPQAIAPVVEHAPAVGAAGEPIHPQKRHCHLCARRIDWKVGQQCGHCQRFVCNKHSH